MSAPFDALEDRLLRGGIAPRHVRRYLRELTEHLADLTQAEAEAGFGADDAAARARAALGPDAELADAMLKQRDFRSLCARFPWLVFGVMPPLALLLSAFLQVVLFIVLARLSGGIGPHGVTFPERLRPVAGMMQVFGNFIAVPAIALLFVALALRQRLALPWPVLSALLIVGLSLHWDTAPWFTDPHGWGAAGLSYRFGASGDSVRFGFTPVFLYAWWKVMAAHGFMLTAQYTLTLLPLAWLVRKRRNARAST